MRFIEGSRLSGDELWALSQTLVAAYGEAARDVVNDQIDACHAADDFSEYAAWLNVSLAVLATLRPGALPGTRT